MLNIKSIHPDLQLVAKAARSNLSGTIALFVSDSRTEKTKAAEMLARDLNLELMLIDLSKVVSKYIGETEKNLSRIFDAARGGGGILLFFDEADALFGKRTEIKDMHDRFENDAVDYLLKRLENFRGLAILATNTKESIEQTFLKKIPYIIEFPYRKNSLKTL